MTELTLLRGGGRAGKAFTRCGEEGRSGNTRNVTVVSGVSGEEYGKILVKFLFPYKTQK